MRIAATGLLRYNKLFTDLAGVNRLTYKQKEFLMSIEQVSRDFITHMADVEKTKAHLTADAVVSGGVLPQPLPAMEALKIVSGLKTAMPDFKIEVQQVTVNGKKVTPSANA